MMCRAVLLAVAVVIAAQSLHDALTIDHLLVESALMLPVALFAVAAGARSGPFAIPVMSVLLTAALIPAATLHGLFMPDGHVEQVGHALADALSLLPFTVAASAMSRARPRLPRRSLVLGMALVSGMSIISTAPAAVASHAPFSQPLTIPPVLTGDNISIDMREADVPILPGAPTKMWTYDGVFPGPTIRRPSGSTTEVTFTNNLPNARHMPEATIHHHGNHSAASEDGPPASELIPTGGSRTYTYDFVEDGVPERAAFQWYHDHRMDVTGRNVWMGLAGMVILDEPIEQALNLPSGAHDVPLMVVDREFNANNQLVYDFDPNGVQGRHILVNGTPEPYFNVGDRKYRFRLLNASNIRSYEFALYAGTTPIPMTQIATEGGLLPAPVQRSRIRLAPAERAEVVIDFAGRLGENLVLRNLLGGPAQQRVMQFRVNQDVVDTSEVKPQLRPVPETDEAAVSLTRTWVLSAQVDPLVWTINGRPYDADRVDTAPLNPVLGSTERWMFVNATTAEHVVHIHDVDWRLVRRVGITSSDPEAEAVERMSLKESFLIRPGETIEVISRFTDHVGRYVLHCHMLEHEDRAMMANFEVVPPAI